MLQPAAEPSPSVTHVRLGVCFNQPLQPGSIPEGVVHLQLGYWSTQRLLAGVLPTSPREFAMSPQYYTCLQPGSPPHRLEVLVLPLLFSGHCTLVSFLSVCTW